MKFPTTTLTASALLLSIPTLTTAQAQTCPAGGQLSCQNTTAVANTCCFNAPGGSLLQTQFWDYSPATGPADAWTIHGLWPDHCDGSFDANCDANRAYTNITQILQAAGKTDLLSYMQTYWKDYQGDDESFWEHEWGKHGTCISTLDPKCYTNYKPTEEAVDFFDKTVSLYKSLDSYALLKSAGILPDNSKKYSLSDVQSALAKGHNGLTPVVKCKSGAINEIWYYFNVRGSVQSGEFVAVASDGTQSNCPSSISYIPKGSSPTPTSTSSSPSSPSPTSTAGAFTGKGYLNITPSGTSKSNGCLISSGKWFTSGTCASFTAAAATGGFTLKGSKGFCGILSDGSIDCAQSTGAVFSSSGANLVYSGSAKFFAAAVASGQTQQSVFVNSKAVEVAVGWQGV